MITLGTGIHGGRSVEGQVMPGEVVFVAKGSDMRSEEVEVIRHTLGLSQVEMGQLCGVAGRVVQRWLSPTDSNPTQDNAAKLIALKEAQYAELDARVQQAVAHHRQNPDDPVEVYYFTDHAALEHVPGLPVPTMNAQVAFLGILEALLRAYQIPFTRVYV